MDVSRFDRWNSEMRVSIKSASNRDIDREIEMIQESFGYMIYECEYEKLINVINSLYHVLS